MVPGAVIFNQEPKRCYKILTEITSSIRLRPLGRILEFKEGCEELTTPCGIEIQKEWEGSVKNLDGVCPSVFISFEREFIGIIGHHSPISTHILHEYLHI